MITHPTLYCEVLSTTAIFIYYYLTIILPTILPTIIAINQTTTTIQLQLNYQLLSLQPQQVLKRKKVQKLQHPVFPCGPPPQY